MHTQAKKQELLLLQPPQHAAGNTSSLPPLPRVCLSSPPAELLFLFPLFICIFSLRRSSSHSFGQEEEVSHAREVTVRHGEQCARSMHFKPEHYEALKYVLSALCIIPPLPFQKAHLTSASRPRLLVRERDRRPPPVYTLHTTSCINQSGARAGRQTWKAHSYNNRSIRLALGRRRQGRREGQSVQEQLGWGAFI